MVTGMEDSVVAGRPGSGPVIGLYRDRWWLINLPNGRWACRSVGRSSPAYWEGSGGNPGPLVGAGRSWRHRWRTLRCGVAGELLYWGTVRWAAAVARWLAGTERIVPTSRWGAETLRGPSWWPS